MKTIAGIETSMAVYEKWSKDIPGNINKSDCLGSTGIGLLSCS
ncbi:hypothetical protein [uncultured Desulfobulbus sp.]|nr:hypothetical protein [uncultured Desulfobulbus sp.]